MNAPLTNTPPQADPFAGVDLSVIDFPDKPSPLEDSYKRTIDLQPDASADVLRISSTLNEAPGLVAENMDAAKKAADLPSREFFADIEKRYPVTARHLSDPTNMSIAKDDIPNHVEHEDILQKFAGARELLSSAWTSGRFQESLGFLSYQKLEGDTRPSVDAEIARSEARLAELSKDRPEVTGVLSALKRGVYGATEFLPQIIGSVVSGAKYGLPFAAMTAAATIETGPGVAITAPAAFAGGTVIGAFEYNYKMMAGLAYNDFRKLRDEKGNPIPANVARVSAMATGAAAAGLGLIKLDAILKSVPGGQDFLRGLTEKFGAQALKKIGYRQAVMSFAKDWAISAGEGAAAMVGITGANIAGEEAAKALSGQKFEETPGAITGRLEETAKDALLTFGVMALPGLTGKLGIDLRRAGTTAEIAKNMHLAVADAASRSKVLDRLPDGYRAAFQQMAAESKVETAYIPAKQFDSYFQSQNLDPMAEARRLGIHDKLKEARESGADVAIPYDALVAEYGKTEHLKNLADDVKFSPEALTARETRDIRADVEKQIDAEAAKAEGAVQTDARSKTDFERIADDIRTKQVEAGKPDAMKDGEWKKLVDANAKLYAAHVVAEARRRGQTVDEYYTGIVKPAIQAGDEASLQHAAQAQGQDQLNQASAFQLQTAIPLPEKAKVIQIGKTEPATADSRRAAADNASAKFRGKAFTNAHTGWEILVARSGLRKGASSDRTPVHQAMLGSLDKLIENGVYLRSEQDRSGRPDIRAWHLFYAPAEIEGKFHLAKLYVKETTQGERYYDHAVIESERPAGYLPDRTPLGALGTEPAAGPSDVSVSDLVGLVKAQNEKTPFFQGEAAPRGSVFFTPEQSVITLFKRADASTFLHESAHIWLEDAFRYVKSGAADEGYLGDWQKLTSWLGLSEDQARLTTDQQEKFARGFEAYVREGKAPSEGLRKVFAQFRSWLNRVYRDASGLNVELSDDVRSVMSRMLASEEEVQAAEQRSGLTDVGTLPDIDPRIRAKIEDLRDRARNQAIDSVMKDEMAKLRALSKDLLGSERVKIETATRERLSNEPAYVWIADVKDQIKGVGPEKLARQIVDGEASAGRAESFEAIAALKGFSSGHEFAQRILATVPLEDAIKAEVDQQMAGVRDIADRNQLRAQAEEAVHNDRQLDVLALEHEALVKLIRQKEVGLKAAEINRSIASAEARFAKERAREVLGLKPVKEAISHVPYFTAERRAAVDYAKALAKDNHVEAADAKRRQLLNHALATEAFRNRREAEKIGAFLEPFQRRGNDLKDMPYGFIRQIDRLLDSFGLGSGHTDDLNTLTQIAEKMAGENATPADVANATGLVNEGRNWRRETLPELVTRVNDDYYALALPASVFGEAKAFDAVTLAEMRDLRLAVKSVAEVGRSFDRFLSDFIKADIRQAARETAESITREIGGRYTDKLAPGHSMGPMAERVRDILSTPDKLIESQVNLLTLCKFLDGGKADGPMQNYVYRLLSSAENEKLRHYEKATEGLNELFAKHFEAKDLGRYKTESFFSEAVKRSFTHEEILAMALNWGNEGNRDRIRRGFDFSDEQVGALFEHLTEKDWKFAQAVWDHLDTYWPEVAALEMKMRGVDPRRVENAAVETKYGTLRGGYYPLAYDYARSADAFKTAEMRNELYKQFSPATAQTEQGHTQQRVNSLDRPVRLSLDVLPRHIEDVVHDLAYRPAVIDATRFMKRPEVRDAIANAVDIQGINAIERVIKSVASDQGDNVFGFEKALRWFRFRTTFATLAYRAFTLPIDLTGNVINGIWEVGPVRMGQAIKDFATSPAEITGFVKDNSERMRLRATMRDRDVMDVARKWEGKNSRWKQFAFYTQALADEAVAFPLWKNVYETSVAEHGADKARHIADEAVTRTLGSGSILDRVGAQSGGEGRKALTMYFSWSSMMFNRMWSDGKLAGLEYRRENRMAATMIMAKAALFGVGLQSVNESFWRELMRNSTNDDPDKRRKRVLARGLSQLPGYVVGLREVLPYAIDRALGVQAHIQTPLQNSAETVMDALVDAGKQPFDDKEIEQKDLEKAAKAAAVLFSYPQTANALAFNFLDWLNENGDASWKDLLSRRTKR